MARTSDLFQTGVGGTYIETIGSPNGYDILINGSNHYLNFNSVVGSSGYGFRDNAGTIEVKNSGGSWASFASLSPISSVTATNTTLTISPTTGAVLAGLNLANANTWTGQQTFSTLSPIVSTLTATRVLFAGASTEIKDDATFTYNDTTNTLSVSRGSFTPLINDAYADTATNYILNGNPFVTGLTDWTSTGWAYDASNGGSAKHTTGNTNRLGQSISPPQGVVRVQYSIGSTGTTGTLRLYVNGVLLGSSATAGTKTIYFFSNGGGDLIEFEPSSTQTRVIYGVTVNPIIASDPAIQFRESGQNSFEGRASFLLNNIGLGVGTLSSLITGSNNLAVGTGALKYNVAGTNNVALGYQTLQFATSSFNTAIGAVALANLTTGNQNFACGYFSGSSLTTGSNNTLAGNTSGRLLTTGSGNTIYGAGGGSGATTAVNNTIIGNNTAQSLSTGSNNLFLGYNVSYGVATQTGCIMIGAGSYIFTLADYSMVLGNHISGINGSVPITSAVGFGMASVAGNRMSATAVGSSITGTTTVSGSTAIAGTSTLFLTELAVGNSVAVYNLNEDTYYYTTIATITNNTTLTLTGSGGSDSSVTIYKAGKLFNGYNLAGTSVMNIDELGRISTGLGTTASSAQLQSQSTTEQLRLNYDASNYFSTTVGSTGGVTFNAVGSGSAFTFSDSIALPYNPQTANYTITTNDHLVNCTANTFTVTLPTAVGITGRIYKIKNSGTGIITVATTSSQTIDGITTQTLNQYDSIEVMSNAANWIIT